VCKEPMSGPSYRCTSCNFFLHKKCAELPPEIKQHLHPEHPLRLLPNHDIEENCKCEWRLSLFCYFYL
jgi:hypothetical protein